MFKLAFKFHKNSNMAPHFSFDGIIECESLNPNFNVPQRMVLQCSEQYFEDACKIKMVSNHWEWQRAKKLGNAVWASNTGENPPEEHHRAEWGRVMQATQNWLFFHFHFSFKFGKLHNFRKVVLDSVICYKVLDILQLKQILHINGVFFAENHKSWFF